MLILICSFENIYIPVSATRRWSFNSSIDMPTESRSDGITQHKRNMNQHQQFVGFNLSEPKLSWRIYCKMQIKNNI